MPAGMALHATLLRLLGPEASALLSDPEVTEVYAVEGDSCLWVDRLGEGRGRSLVEVPAERAEMLLNAVASAQGVKLRPGQPILSAELPEGMGRLQGFLSPVTRQAFFVPSASRRQQCSRLPPRTARGLALLASPRTPESSLCSGKAARFAWKGRIRTESRVLRGMINALYFKSS